MQEKKRLQLNDISAHKVAFNLSNYVWRLVEVWPAFSRDTVGKQYIRALDSISSNLAEGFGRHNKKR
jgi:four helix bundle protein